MISEEVFRKKSLSFIPILFLFGFLSSCVTQRKVEYLQDQAKEPKSFSEASVTEYRIKSDDELYIQVNSLDESAANVFANAGQWSLYSGSLQPYGASLISYKVDKDGFLMLPVIGKILVKDKTLSEVTVMIRESLKNVLNQPAVSVKLVNRYVSVLGEVRDPGHFPIAQEKLTVFDAIGMAGDVTEYGNRREVVLIRNSNGENTRVSLNLTKSEILGSEYYHIKPNDIVYVKPLREKFWGMRQFPFAVLFSTITTGLLIYNVWK
jgi:polysaccharide export outer membrane protein